MNSRIRPKSLLTISPASTWIAVVLIVSIGLISYSNNYRGEFIFDDFVAIVDNPEVHSLSPITPLLRPAPNTPVSARPVVAITLALNYALGGLDVRGYHLVNNCIHILVGLMFFGLVRTTLLLPRFAPTYGSSADVLGLTVALVWLVHPLNTETVNYIISRTESLVGLFYFATMFFASRAFTTVRSQKWYVAAVISCSLGMATKEVMVTAPLLVLLYDRLYVSGSFSAALKERRFFYVSLATTWLIVAFYQLDNPRADSVRFDSASLTVWDYLFTQFTVIVHYLRLSIWPHPLVLDNQDWPIVKDFTASFFLSVSLIATLAAFTIAGLVRNMWWSILGVWFFFILAPTSSIIPIVSEIVSERRMYLPLAAVVVLLGFAGDHLRRKFADNKAVQIVSKTALIFVIVLFATLTYTRNHDYRTAISIWSDNVAKRPGNSRAQENLGKALARVGRHAEAIGPFREALRSYPLDQPKPELAEIYSNLGAALSQTGQFEEAVLMHYKAMELLPDDVLMHYHLGNAYLRANDLRKAASAFQAAIKVDPDFPPARGNLGLVLMQLGDYTAAEQHLLTLVKLVPGDSFPYVILADLRTEQGRIREAVHLYRQALKLSPGYPGIEAKIIKIEALQVQGGADSVRKPN